LIQNGVKAKLKKVKAWKKPSAEGYKPAYLLPKAGTWRSPGPKE
jgi:hypothetical protein